MKPLSLIALLTILAALRPSHAQTDLADNAALVYWPAFCFILNEDHDRFDLTKDSEQVVQLDDDLRDLLSDHEITIEMLIRGAGMDHCDFGIRTPTFDTLVPQVGHGRIASRLLVCDAVRLFRENDKKAGAARLIAALEVLEDSTASTSTMGCLVRARGTGFLADVVRDCIDQELIKPEELVALGERLAWCRERDAFGIKDSVESEKLFIRNSISQAMAKSNTREEFMEWFAEIIGAPTVDSITATLFRHPDWRERAEKYLTELDRYMAKMAEALASDEPVKNAAALEDSLEEDPFGFGPFVVILAPQLSRAYGSAEQERAKVVQLLDRIESPQAPD